MYSQKNRYPGKVHCTFDSPENLSLLSLLKEVKPTANRKMKKLVTIDNSFQPDYDILAQTRRVE